MSTTGCPDGHDLPDGDCRWCKMATERDPRYARRWFGDAASGTAGVPRPRRLRAVALLAAANTPPPCVHRGGPTGEQADCQGCGQRGRTADVYACAVYGKCTHKSAKLQGREGRLGRCSDCPDRLSPPEEQG